MEQLQQMKVQTLPHDGQRIRLKFAFNADLIQWVKEEIPGREWFPGRPVVGLFGDTGDREGAGWLIPLQPLSCGALIRTCPVTLDLAATPEVRQIAGQMAELAAFSVDMEADYPQPEIRQLDAWRHQLAAYHFALKMNCCCMLAMGMGTGKSKVAVDLAINQRCRRILILAPPTVLGVWRREIPRHAPQAESLILDDSHKSTADKTAAARRFMTAAEFSDRPFFVVINYESARVETFAKWATSQPWDLVLLDESHRAKSPTGVTSKMCNRLRPVARRRICLTGTPMAHSPADLYSQFRFINPQVFGDSYTRFKKRYAIEGEYIKGQIVGWRNKDDMQRAFHSHAIVIDESVLDLPPEIHVEREFDLPRQSLAIYRELWREMFVATNAGTCSADNVLVKMIRAAQITSGFLMLDESADPFSDDVPADEFQILNDSKEQLLIDVLRDNQEPGPVVVFCRFRYDLDSVRRAADAIAKERGGEFRYGEISGRQKDLTPTGELPDGIDVFGVQVQSGGVGLDFTAAAIAVLYSIDFSLGNYEQMLRRLLRPGQSRSVRYVHLIARKTIDRLVYQRLEQRKEVISEIVDAIKNGSLDLESGVF